MWGKEMYERNAWPTATRTQSVSGTLVSGARLIIVGDCVSYCLPPGKLYLLPIHNPPSGGKDEGGVTFPWVWRVEREALYYPSDRDVACQTRGTSDRWRLATCLGIPNSSP